MMTNNKKVLKFVEDSAALACPDKIVWIDGSEAQRDALARGSGRFRRNHQAQRGASSRLLPAQNGGKRRRPRRGQNVHLQPERRGRASPFHRQMDGSRKGV